MQRRSIWLTYRWHTFISLVLDNLSERNLLIRVIRTGLWQDFKFERDVRLSGKPDSLVRVANDFSVLQNNLPRVTKTATIRKNNQHIELGQSSVYWPEHDIEYMITLLDVLTELATFSEKLS